MAEAEAMVIVSRFRVLLPISREKCGFNVGKDKRGWGSFACFEMGITDQR